MLRPALQVDDSVGIPFSSNSVDDFEAEVRASLHAYGAEKFRDGVFYVLGVPMHLEKKFVRDYARVISVLELDRVNASVRILSVPSRLVQETSVSLARHVLQRIGYFFPSLKRDVQAPQWGEIVTNWQATLAIESVNVFFLFHALPVEQAAAIVATHAVVLNAYTIFAKSLINYLRRPGSTNAVSNNVEMFLKQMMLGAPFVLNYNIFCHFSEILNFYQTRGWAATASAFPYELGHFGSTQGLTLVLHTIFFSQIITGRFGGWVDTQVGDQNTRDARTLRPLLQVPVLAAEAVLLVQASSSHWAPLLSLGPLDVNAGHVGIAALTGLSLALFAKFPRVFDPILGWYQSRRERRIPHLEGEIPDLREGAEGRPPMLAEDER